MGTLSPTSDDIAELLRRNPIAAEQLKVIMLQRRNAELQARVDELERTSDKDSENGSGLNVAEIAPLETKGAVSD